MIANPLHSLVSTCSGTRNYTLGFTGLPKPPRMVYLSWPSRRWNGYSVRVRLRCAIEQPVAIHESETEEIVAPVKSRGKRKPLPANQLRVEALHTRPNTHFAER